MSKQGIARLVFAGIVAAAAVATALVQSDTVVTLPYNGVPIVADAETVSGSMADELFCVDFIPAVGISNATEVVVLAQDTSGTFSYGLFANGGATKLFVVSESAGSNGSWTDVQHFTVSAFNMTAGVEHRLCWCHNNGTGFSYAGGLTGGTTNVQDSVEILNSFTTKHYGIETNGCTSGVVPNTVTSIGTDAETEHIPPIVLLGTSGLVVTTTSTT